MMLLGPMSKIVLLLFALAFVASMVAVIVLLSFMGDDATKHRGTDVLRPFTGKGTVILALLSLCVVAAFMALLIVLLH